MQKKPRKTPSTKEEGVQNSLPGTTKHVVIPDGQVKPGTPIDHWEWAWHGN